MGRIGCGVAIAALALIGGPVSAAVIVESATLLAPPTGTIATARAINAQGRIIGWFPDIRIGVVGNPAGFIATPSAGGGYTVQRLPTSGSSSYQWVQPYAINDLNAVCPGGCIVGQAQGNTDLVPYAFINSNPGSKAVSAESEATGVNNARNVSGWLVKSNNDVEAFFRRASDGTLHSLPIPASGDPPRESRALDLNDGDQLAGYYVNRTGSSKAYRGFVFDWPTQQLTELGLITVEQPSASNWMQEIRAVSINNSGHVAATHGVASGNSGNGTGDGNSVNRAFLFRGAGDIVELGTVGGFEESFATAISDIDWVVGLLRDKQLDDSSFLWVAGQMLDLSTLARLAGWDAITAVHGVYSDPLDPNDALHQSGVIVGDALFNGEQRAFAMSLVVEVPEPHIYLLFGIGLIAVGAMRLRRLRGAAD